MKRLNANEWTDGKDIYYGNPRDGFIKKDEADSIDTLTFSMEDYEENTDGLQTQEEEDAEA